MFDEIAAAFLAALAFQATDYTDSPAPEADDKPIFVRSYEHPLPTVREYKVAGVFGAQETSFVLSLRFRNGQWDVQLESGIQSPLKVRLDKAYNSIPVSGIVAAVEDGDRRLVALIPFGKPHSECFGNGDEVYSQLSIRSAGEVRLEHFPKCVFEEGAPPVSKSRGVLLVGPPPQSR
jgi:hypothetical protein